MSAKIRLQRHGRKKRAFFHIVVADSRAPRDGRFIEKLGTYNPISNPATIDLNLDKAVSWLSKGAQPTDTARAILSYKGALYKHHLQVGVTKGAISQEEADKRFDAWMQDKEGRIQAKRERLAGSKSESLAGKMKQEAAKRDAIAARVAAKLVVPAEEEAPVAEEVPTAEEAPAAEDVAADDAETAAETEGNGEATAE
jgi:small subunit ribosomal protein S16